MRHIHLDPLGGAAGDMFAAALLDAFPQHAAAAAEAAARLSGTACRVVPHDDGILTGRRFVVDAPSGADPGHDHAGHPPSPRRHDHGPDGHGHDDHGHPDHGHGGQSLRGHDRDRGHGREHDDGHRHHAHDHHHDSDAGEISDGAPDAPTRSGRDPMFHVKHIFDSATEPSGQAEASSPGREPAPGSWRALRARIGASDLPDPVRRHALGIFETLADAEARVHGVPPAEVTFHEVGAADSVADIVAAAWVIAAVAPACWSVGALPLGSGTVRTAHGPMPVPAPATALLLEGFLLRDDGVAGERVTPTGAAILRHLGCAGAARPRSSILRGSGTGFGSRVLPGMSNCLRALVLETQEPEARTLPDPRTLPGARALPEMQAPGTPTEAPEPPDPAPGASRSPGPSGSASQPDGAAPGPQPQGADASAPGHRALAVIAFEVDDQSGEDLASGLDRVRALDGVHDVVQMPAFGKKNRLAVHVQVLVRPDRLEAAVEACFAETTTIGLRTHLVQGRALPRRFAEVAVEGRPVTVKLVERPGGVTAKAEADSLRPVAGHAARTSLRREAERRAEAELE